MARFVGVKHNRICVISDNTFDNSVLDIIEIPAELTKVSSAELLTDYTIRDGKLKKKISKKTAKELKVALVGNWKMRCGIATYSEHLWPEIVKHIGDFKLFIEKNDISTGDIHQIGNQIVPDSQVSVCWKRGESLQTLVKELKEYDPDIILIQHEFGLWSNASYWLAMMNQLSDYRVIVTMHSVFRHKDKTIIEASIPEIIVHLEGARQVLKEEKKITSKVYVIPHGCYDYSGEKLWNFYKSDKTFMQFGFAFRYKGWEKALQATAILKEKYPDVFFTGLLSESPYNKVGHEIYYNELMVLVDDLKIQENVSLLRGYQSDSVIDSFMRTNQATIFPYTSHPEHEVFGASGAARMAMAKGLPVITSNVNHFSDLPTIKADTPEELAKALEVFFTDPGAKEKQLQKQKSYLMENTWEKIGLRYVELFEK
ncbi:MAG TPA: glycosyltransferase [Candidatus Saccharimonadales bacterium]